MYHSSAWLPLQSSGIPKTFLKVECPKTQPQN